MNWIDSNGNEIEINSISASGCWSPISSNDIKDYCFHRYRVSIVANSIEAICTKCGYATDVNPNDIAGWLEDY